MNSEEVAACGGIKVEILRHSLRMTKKSTIRPLAQDALLTRRTSPRAFYALSMGLGEPLKSGKVLRAVKIVFIRSVMSKYDITDFFIFAIIIRRQGL